MADEATEDRVSSSGDDELDETDTALLSRKDGVNIEAAHKRSLHALDYFICNGLRQVFQQLDVKSKGSLAKTQLQVICANACNVLKLKYTAEDLVGYQNDKSELKFDEFITYVNNELLPKVSGEKIDIEKFDRVAWTIVEKERKVREIKVLSDEELFRLWQAFNKIIIDNTVTIDIEEAAILLQEFMQATGTPWTRGPLDDFTEKLQLTFWELITCLEKKYINNTPKSVYQEGLDSITNKYITEVIKTGTLTKKGHRIKSMKSRWFILLRHQLSYHENKNNLNKKKGIIAINKLAKVESIADSKNTKCRFLVVCGNKSTQYEMEAADHKTKNEWILAIQQCIDSVDDEGPLQKELKKRFKERAERRAKQAEEERQRLEQQELIRKQLEELELIRQARDQAQAQANSEAAMLEEERKRREELEAVKAEYERLLEEEKQAREAESKVRSRQQEILEEEMTKRQELEKIKAEQDRILEEERKVREGLEEVSKEQAKALEEERERLKTLDKARQAAEAEVEAAHAKLEEAEAERRAAAAKVEEAKQKTRRMRMPVGLARPLALEQKGLTTHRGLGSFVDQDFSKMPLYLSAEEKPEAINKRDLPGEERAQIVKSHLVKPSQGKQTFEGAGTEVKKTEAAEQEQAHHDVEEEKKEVIADDDKKQTQEATDTGKVESSAIDYI